MRLPFAVCLVLAVSAPAFGQPRSVAQSNRGGIRSDEQNEQRVRALYDRFAAAWNRHDVEALGALWTIDGDHLEPDGAHAKGRADVSVALRRQHDTVFKQSHLALNIADVWFVGDSVALVDGGYEITGIRTPDGDELPGRRGHLTAVLMQEGAEWRIAASRLMVPAELPYKRRP